MGFLSSIMERKSESAAASEPVDEVHRARSRARQRLIGAVVLLTIGVIGFPLVFETQPRPIAVDIPIEIPRKDGLPPLLAPAPARPNPSPLASTPPSNNDNAATVPAPPGDAVISESREEAGRDGSSARETAAHAAEPAASRPAARMAARPEVAKPIAKPDTGDDGARARALLDGKAPVTNDVAATARFIVQVGAFADATAAQDTRSKIEKLGLKTYTQVASTPAGNRIRVRVGPYPTRDEADKALAKARGAGLSAVLLTL